MYHRQVAEHCSWRWEGPTRPLPSLALRSLQGKWSGACITGCKEGASSVRDLPRRKALLSLHDEETNYKHMQSSVARTIRKKIRRYGTVCVIWFVCSMWVACKEHQSVRVLHLL